MKNYILTFVFSALSLLATAQTFNEKTFADIIQSYQKDIGGYLKTNAAPDYTFTTNGQVLDAKAFINRFETFKVTTFETSNVKVRQYGTAAFATGTAHHVYTSKTDGSTLDYTALFSYTFAYQGGKWLILGGQHSDVLLDQKKGQTIQKGNQVGIHIITVEPKPNVTMEQVLDFYNTKWIPDADKYFGFKFYTAKCLRGTGCAENKILLISHHKTEADRDKYFKMAEGGRDLNELGAKAWAQFAPTNDALLQLATVKDEWVDWVIK